MTLLVQMVCQLNVEFGGIKERLLRQGGDGGSPFRSIHSKHHHQSSFPLHQPISIIIRSNKNPILLLPLTIQLPMIGIQCLDIGAPFSTGH